MRRACRWRAHDAPVQVSSIRLGSERLSCLDSQEVAELDVLLYCYQRVGDELLRWAPARDLQLQVESNHGVFPRLARGRIPTQLYLPNVSGLRILFESVYRRTPKRLPIGIIVSAVSCTLKLVMKTKCHSIKL